MQKQSSGCIGIVGLGLIGGSLGLDLQKIGYTVYGITHREETATKAKERKLVNFVSTNPNSQFEPNFGPSHALAHYFECI